MLLHPHPLRSSRRVQAACAAALAVLVLASAACAKNDTPAASGSQGTSAGGRSAGGSAAPNTRVFGPTDDATPTPGGRLIMGVEAETEALDPSRVPFAASGYFVASSVFDSLATLDKDGKPVPFLAQSIEGSDGAKTWTITLRPGVTFHNGDALDSAAVKADFEMFQRSAITSAFFRTVSAIEAPAKDKVVVKLSQPWVAFPVALTTQIGYVMHPKMIDDPQLAYTPIGTGPFMYDKHTMNEVWQLKKNPSYWRKDSGGRALPYLDAIEFRVRVDEDRRMREFQSGDLDLIHTVKPNQTVTLRGLDNIKRVEYSDGEKDFLSINTEEAPFNELSARKAVAYAVDTAKWRKEITQDVKQPLNSPFGPTQPGYSDNSGYPSFNLDEAKKLVKEYETKTGKSLEFEYTAGDDPSDRTEAQLLVDMMRAAGMKVTIRSLGQAQLIAHVVTGDYQVSIWRNFGMPDPDADTIWWRSESILPKGGVSLNTARFKDAEIDKAIDDALAATTPQAKDAAYKKVATRMAEQVPYIWLGRVVWNLAANKRVNGIYPAANGSIQTLGEKSWIGEVWIKQ